MKLVKKYSSPKNFTAGVDKNKRTKIETAKIMNLLKKKSPLPPPILAQKISIGLSSGFIEIFNLLEN